MDDDIVRKKPVLEVGMVLDALSIDELHERIALLREEIARIEGAIESKTKGRAAADAVFKI
ncbi:MAG: DUF1192 domain-containing protein [Phyllobacteriaceae bacterium]|nr:DUF1192 domain-containing protein [Phyllobacteriaceae bacterium]